MKKINKSLILFLLSLLSSGSSMAYQNPVAKKILTSSSNELPGSLDDLSLIASLSEKKTRVSTPDKKNDSNKVTVQKNDKVSKKDESKKQNSSTNQVVAKLKKIPLKKTLGIGLPSVAAVTAVVIAGVHWGPELIKTLTAKKNPGTIVKEKENIININVVNKKENNTNFLKIPTVINKNEEEKITEHKKISLTCNEMYGSIELSSGNVPVKNLSVEDVKGKCGEYLQSIIGNKQKSEKQLDHKKLMNAIENLKGENNKNYNVYVWEQTSDDDKILLVTDYQKKIMYMVVIVENKYGINQINLEWQTDK